MNYLFLPSVLLTNNWRPDRLIRTQPCDLPVSIWDPSSSYLQTIQKVDAIYQNLPDMYRLNDVNIPQLQENRQLGGVLLLYFLMYSIVSDITRPSLPGYSFPLATAFQEAPQTFRSQCQERCRFEAVRITGLIRTGLTYGRVLFDDIFPRDAALEAAKIQIVYSAAINQSPEIMQETRENINTTLYFFTLWHHGKHGHSEYVRAKTFNGHVSGNCSADMDLDSNFTTVLLSFRVPGHCTIIPVR